MAGDVRMARASFLRALGPVEICPDILQPRSVARGKGKSRDRYSDNKRESNRQLSFSSFFFPLFFFPIAQNWALNQVEKK